MRRSVIILLLAALACAAPASAQSQDSPGGRSIIKILIGSGALVIGTAVAAKSSDSTTVSTPFGTNATTTSFSKSQLITGLTIAGVGGIILWDGLRRHDHSYPTTQVGIAVGPSRAAVLVQRRIGQAR